MPVQKPIKLKYKSARCDCRHLQKYPAQPACPPSLISCLSVLEESSPSVPGACGYSEAGAVLDVPRCESRVHTRGHGGSKALDGSPDSILSSEPKPLGKHGPPPPLSKSSPGGSSYLP
ncbi:hypothetical protein Tco_0227090 [Tanacetum coccineum]